MISIRRVVPFLVFALLVQWPRIGSSALDRSPRTPKPDWEYVQTQLQKAKIKPAFIEFLQSIYEEKDFAKVLEYNLLLYLRKTDVHGPQVTEEAVRSVRSFLKKNQSTFSQAEAEFGVSGAIIASLLWIESRYGSNRGKYHVASSFLHLVQADRTDLIEYHKKKSLDYLDRPSLKVRKEIKERSKSKAKWALTEIKALEKLHKKDPELIKKLKGSYAGAMGMPQFLPSSFVAYARSAQKKAASPDLTHAEDAILSVAYYLKKNGWKEKKSKTHSKALHRYNNSDDYVNSILELAARVDEIRNLSSEKSGKKNRKKK